MKIKINWKYAKGELESTDIRLICIPANKVKGKKEAELCIHDGNGVNYSIAEIDLGDSESSNKLCAEIARRFNNFKEVSDKESRTITFDSDEDEKKRIESVRWRAKKDEYYYYVCFDGSNIYCSTEDFYDTDDKRYNCGNYFRTEQEAKESAIYKAFIR